MKSERNFVLNTKKPVDIESEATRHLQKDWDEKASEWEQFVGKQGNKDPNRLYNSDPKIFELLGDIKGLTVLDAGCGNGYMTTKLQKLEAKVIGIDISENMINIARRNNKDVDFRVDDASSLLSIQDNSVDAIVSNYVLMDLPDLDKSIEAFYRVLKKGGRCVLVFLHPCFPLYSLTNTTKDDTYTWTFNYFKKVRITAPPFHKKFSSKFTFFHRPLSEYWSAFTKHGFVIKSFQEPYFNQNLSTVNLTPEKEKHLKTPISVVFLLEKCGPSMKGE